MSEKIILALLELISVIICDKTLNIVKLYYNKY